MNRLPGLWLTAFLAVGILGCGRSGDSGATADNSSTGGATAAVASRPQGDGPETAVFDFLEAVRTGANDRAGKMLTPIARQKVAEQHLVVAPPGSATAKFELGEVQSMGEDAARVVIKWTDLDENGKPRTDQVTWMVRKVEEGWRIAGVAAPVFDGEPPLLLNFEDPEEMLHQQQLVREEMRRRAEAEQQHSQPAATAEKSADKPVATEAQQAASPEKGAVR